MADSKTKFWRFSNSADGESAELFLYGVISEYSWWDDDVTPKQFNDDLAALGDVKSIKLRINSPGGDVFAAAAIHNALKNHKAKVTTYVDGLAASAASVVAMAGDVVVMPKTAMMMIHNPSAMVWGDARDMRATADVLDKVRDSIIAAYEGKTGKTRSELINLLNSETWMTAQDALDMGFADEIDDQMSVSACVRGPLMIVNNLGFDLSCFKTIPAAILAGGKEVKPNMSVTNPSNEALDEEPEVVDTPAAGEEPETPAAAEPVAEPEAEPAAEPETGSDDPVAAERMRITAIYALQRPGAESIIAQAVNDGWTAEATALKILQSDDVRNAQALANRRGDAPSLAPGGDPQPSAKTEKVGILAAALKKIRNIKD